MGISISSLILGEKFKHMWSIPSPKFAPSSKIHTRFNQYLHQMRRYAKWNKANRRSLIASSTRSDKKRLLLNFRISLLLGTGLANYFFVMKKKVINVSSSFSLMRLSTIFTIIQHLVVVMMLWKPVMKFCVVKIFYNLWRFNVPSYSRVIKTAASTKRYKN